MIFSQAAFLSALAGTDVAEAAAQAAIAALTENRKGGVGSLFSNATQQGIIGFLHMLNRETDPGQIV